MKKFIMLLFIVPMLSSSQNFNYTDEQLESLKQQAFDRAQTLMLETIFNATKDVKLNQNVR